MVLIAGLEDDLENAEIQAWGRRDTGWEWRLLNGGPDVIDVIAALRPDVLTTGNRHSLVGGVDLLRLVRDRGATRVAPVVLVTAADKEDLWSAIRVIGLDPDAHIVGYVQRPFLMSRLQ
ncbi:MAG TPA: hypothetical protein PLP50_16710 [Thermoanaerobaculia bacterium]|jgi:CheY-like chemotaxis protein|nr:hypothetical protein [Thermoanaerobaculia bacterium]HQN07556.1 hypothetical protein [Thermoanaerobaculia bacterium]HQP86407.1 hypothetical protein [Thermoanaerobaculia bacterium]